MFDDGIEQRFHRAANVVQFHLGETFLRAGVNDGEIKLLIRGVERNKEIKHQVENLVWGGIVTVDLVDDHDGLRAGFEGFAEHKAGLGLRTVHGIDDQQHAVDHIHDSFHFAAEIRVTGGIHDIDVVILVLKSGVFGADGDALFTLEVHRIHEAFLM